MLATIKTRTLLKVLAASSCGLLLSMAVLTADVTAESITITIAPSIGTGATSTTITSSSCLYSLQLTGDASLREAFLARITLVNGAVEDVDESDLYQTEIDLASKRLTKTSGIDSLSRDCLSCHDGAMAKTFNVRIKNNPAGRVMSLEDITGGHPVGMEYDRYVSFNSREYRHEVSFSREMIFAEGKVGCLTCHNPLNGAKGHLVMNNDRSELCFTCHNK